MAPKKLVIESLLIHLPHLLNSKKLESSTTNLISNIESKIYILLILYCSWSNIFIFGFLHYTCMLICVYLFLRNCFFSLSAPWIHWRHRGLHKYSGIRSFALQTEKEFHITLRLSDICPSFILLTKFYFYQKKLSMSDSPFNFLWKVCFAFWILKTFWRKLHLSIFSEKVWFPLDT